MSNKTPWVSVNDALPPTTEVDGWSKDMFVRTNYDELGVAGYNKDGYWDAFAIDLLFGSERVAYWMPAPPAPEGSKEDGMSWQMLLALEPATEGQPEKPKDWVKLGLSPDTVVEEWDCTKKAMALVEEEHQGDADVASYERAKKGGSNELPR